MYVTIDVCNLLPLRLLATSSSHRVTSRNDSADISESQPSISLATYNNNNNYTTFTNKTVFLIYSCSPNIFYVL